MTKFDLTQLLKVRKVTLVQACVRRWLAKLKYKKSKFEAARNAVTLQRHIRGWLTRRKVYALKEQARIQKELVEQARSKRELEERKKMEKLGRLETCCPSRCNNRNLYSC